MTAEWVTVLIDVSLKATVLLLSACVMALLLRRAPAATRHLVWSVALAGVVAMPAISHVAPAVQVPVSADSLLAYIAVQETATPPVPVAPKLWIECNDPASANPTLSADGTLPASTLSDDDPSIPLASTIVRTTSADGPETSADQPRAAASLFLMVWMAGAVLVLFRVVLGNVSVWWIARRTRPLTDPSWTSLLSSVASQLRLSAPVRLLKGRRAASPMAWGILRPIVLLPEEADGWTAERRRVVLLHELGHVRRRDCLTQTVAHVACALYWFNPLVWVAAARMQAERERACDDLVLSTGTNSGDYARHLLDIARSLRSTGTPAWATVGMARRSELEGRLLAILDPTRRRGALSGYRRTTSLVIALMCVAVLGILRPAAPAQAAAIADVSAAAPQNQVPTPPPAPISPEQPLPIPMPMPMPVPRPQVNVDVSELAQRALEDMELSGALDETVIAESVQQALDSVDIDGVAMKALSSVDAEGVAIAAVRGMQSSTARDPKAAEQASKALVTALKDPDADVRMQAAHALGELRSAAAVPALIAALADENAAVRRTTIVALGEIRDRRAVPALVDAVTSEDARVKRAALSALAELRDEAAVPPAIAALKEASPDIRAIAASVLAELRDTRAVEPLIAAMQDSDARVRQHAMSALAELRDNRAVPALVTALKDTDPGVRGRAIAALAELRDPRSVEPLIAAMKDEDAAVRQRAAMALAELRDSRAVPALIAALKDPQPVMRQRAAMALGEIRDTRAIDALTAALNDQDPGVRRRAVSALRELGGS